MGLSNRYRAWDIANINIVKISEYWQLLFVAAEAIRFGAQYDEVRLLRSKD
jgi:hypothetical protein